MFYSFLKNSKLSLLDNHYARSSTESFFLMIVAANDKKMKESKI